MTILKLDLSIRFFATKAYFSCSNSLGNFETLLAQSVLPCLGCKNATLIGSEVEATSCQAMSDDEYDVGAGVLATQDPAAVPGAEAAAAAAAPVAMAGLAGMDPAAYAQWVQALQAQQVAAQQMYLQQIAAAAGAAGGGVLLALNLLYTRLF